MQFVYEKVLENIELLNGILTQQYNSFLFELINVVDKIDTNDQTVEHYLYESYYRVICTI